MRTKFLHIFFILFLFNLIFTHYSLADDIKFKHITINNGLSQNTINSIVQDHKGLIWIGTWDGLNKYDGYGFVVYRNDGKTRNSLSNNRINVVLEDKRKNLWVGTSSGLNLFNREQETFKMYPNTKNTSYYVHSIAEDKNGGIWVATEEGIKFLDPKLGKLQDVKIQQPNNNETRVRSLFVDKNNVLWVGKFAGLIFYDIAKKKTVTLYPNLQLAVQNSWIRAIKYQNDGSFWLATEADGVVHYKNNRQLEYFTSKNGLLTNTVRDILIVNEKEVWIGTKLGLTILNPINFAIKNYTYKKEDESETSLSQASIRTMFHDNKGNVWLGTYSGGVNLVYNFKENFSYKGHAKNDPAKLSNKEVNSIYEDPDKNIWLATDGGGLNYWNRKLNTIKVFKYPTNNITYHTIKRIHPDSQNKEILWLSSGGGVLKFNKRTFSFEQFNFTNYFNLPAFIQEYVFEDSAQGFWIGTNFSGLYLFKDGKKIRSYDYKLSGKSYINSNNITALKNDPGNGIWIGTRASGLNYLNYKTGKISSYVYDKNKASSLSSNNVLSIFKDSKNRLWIGTDGGGLNYFDPKTEQFLTLDERKGLSNTIVHAITEEGDGILWLSTNKGLFKVKLNISANPLKFDDLEILNYTVEDGLQSNQFLHGSVFRGIENELFFGGINGLTTFFPKKLSINNNKPNIVFTDISILGKPITVNESDILKKSIDESNEIVLPYDKAYFTIKFSLLNFVYPEKNKYAFILEGLSNDTWHYVDNQRQATYTNLDPGTYTFKVKAANNSGVWVDEPRTLKVIVLPPWYKTWWAYTIYFAIILFLLYLFYSYTKYKERLKGKIIQEKFIAKQERELAQQKLSFFIKISHEIKTPITMIMAPLQKLLVAHENNPNSYQYLNTMNKSGQRLLNLIDQILDVRKLDSGGTSLKAARGNMVRFIKEIVVVSSNLAKAKNIDLTFSFSDESIETWFDRDKMEKVIYNIISNAIKYTSDYGKITVRVEEIASENKVAIIIADNGCGIAADRLATIFTPFKHADSMLNNVSGTGIGLAFAKELIDQHYGDIKVESSPAANNKSGFTSFTVLLPMGKDYLDDSELDENYLQTENIDNYKDYRLNRQRNFETVKDKIKANHIAESLSMLIVEDNEEVLNFLVDNFKEEFKVSTAINGKIGYDKALKDVPDIIISDVMMPEMDGVELCNLLKENIITSHIPVILLTARSPLLFKLEGLENGADEYISKPFNLDLLEVKVWNLIGNRQKMRSRFQKEVYLEPTNTPITTFEDKFLEKVIKYIEDHIADETLNVEDLSSHVGMTRGHLYKKLKALTSKGPVEFIRYIRLKRAAQLLKLNKMYINEVAFMVGFQDVNYFRKSFKEEFNANPLEFAKQFKDTE